jgi:DNA-directed RNA polymerase subunit RPC12/RpoP
MGSAYVVVCLLCGREVGRVVGGRLLRGPRRPRLVREGRRLRCGHCRGSVFLQPDTEADLPDWVAEMEREAVLDGNLDTPARRARRAG